jgi:hypothetical protein
MKQKTNYGTLTEISKSLNFTFGDKSDRSVSKRTAHGLINTFNLQNVDEELAEHIVHGGMLLTAGLLLSKNKNSVVVGIGILLLLIIIYWNGKNQPKKPLIELNVISYNGLPPTI